MSQPNSKIRKELKDLLDQVGANLLSPEVVILWDSIKESFKSDGQVIAMTSIETRLKTLENEANQAISAALKAQPKDIIS